jgi:hypothetical protein
MAELVACLKDCGSNPDMANKNFWWVSKYLTSPVLEWSFLEKPKHLKTSPFDIQTILLDSSSF